MCLDCNINFGTRSENQNIKSLDSHITQSCLEHKSQFDLDMKPFPALSQCSLGAIRKWCQTRKGYSFCFSKVNDIGTLTVHFFAEPGYSLLIEYNDSK